MNHPTIKPEVAKQNDSANVLQSNFCWIPTVGALGTVIILILFFSILRMQDRGNAVFFAIAILMSLVCLGSALIGPHQFIIDRNGVTARHLDAAENIYRRIMEW